MVHLFDTGFTPWGAALRILVMVGMITSIWLGWKFLAWTAEGLAKRYPKLEPIYSFLALGTVLTGFVLAMK